MNLQRKRFLEGFRRGGLQTQYGSKIQNGTMIVTMISTTKCGGGGGGLVVRIECEYLNNTHPQ